MNCSNLCCFQFVPPHSSSPLFFRCWCCSTKFLWSSINALSEWGCCLSSRWQGIKFNIRSGRCYPFPVFFSLRINLSFTVLCTISSHFPIRTRMHGRGECVCESNTYFLSLWDLFRSWHTLLWNVNVCYWCCICRPFFALVPRFDSLSLMPVGVRARVCVCVFGLLNKLCD